MRRVLGKGLRELMGGVEEDSGIREIPIESIVPNPRQPRKVFDDEALSELAESIEQFGLLQPVVVRPLDRDRYELIAGERRLRASKLAGLAKVPALVRSADHQQSLEMALIENLQREDISPLEAAAAYRAFVQEFDLTQEEIAQRVGKSRAAIANSLRLLKLPDQILDSLSEGAITEGHARALLQFETETEQLLMHSRILAKGLTVREVEKQARVSETKSTKSRTPRRTNPLEASLSELLGAQTRIAKSGKGGQIRIDFYDDEDLQRILEILGVELD